VNSPSYFLQKVEQAIEELDLTGRPAELYDPVRYMMQLGGKRIRPVMVLLANDLFGGGTEDALPAALGIEVFHNFTLLHDDIMDKAPLRRSKPTIHVKWNPDIAILSGDTMFVRSCQLISGVNEKYLKKVLDLFYKTAIQVCEGQQLDMNFENMGSVSIAEYIHMISLKTAVLVGASLAIGSICGGAKEEDTEHIYEFGKNLGIAFQLHDDLLDVYADQAKFGKQVGGDILSNKKTFLLLTAVEFSNQSDRAELMTWMNKKEYDQDEKLSSVIKIYNKNEVKERTEKEMEKYYNLAIRNLNSISVDQESKKMLSDLAQQLMIREK
jgi:geranylgeranyl diphosphate synthase, type II